MKNLLKFSVLAIAIAISFAACKGKGATSGDSTKMDSAKKDTVKKPDSVMVDEFDKKTGKKIRTTLMPAPKDTAKKDTAKKM